MITALLHTQEVKEQNLSIDMQSLRETVEEIFNMLHAVYNRKLTISAT